MLTYTNGHLCVTNRRFILIKYEFQYQSYKKHSDLFPVVTVIDTSSLTRFKKVWCYTIPPVKGISIKGSFIIGNDPSDYNFSRIREEKIFITKNQNDFQFFSQAIEKLDLYLDDPYLNTD